MDKNKKKLKVCILAGYPPAIGRGAEQAQVLTEQLKRFPELEIFVLANKTEQAPPNEIIDGISVFRTWAANSWTSILGNIKRLFKIKPDILHVYNPHLYYGSAVYSAIFTLTILIAARLKRIKSLVWWEHVYPLGTLSKSTLDTYHYKASPTFLRFGLVIYTRLVSTLVRKVLVQTDSDFQNIKELYGVKNAQSLVIGMSGKRESKGKAKKRLGLEDNKKILLAFGFISPFKGLVYAIKAMKKVSMKHPEAVLLIAGCGHPRLPNPEDYINSLKSAANEAGVNNAIIFHDFYIPKSEHSTYFSSSELVLLPYITSLGPSSVGMEAFQYRVPVVATDVDFIREDITHGKTGILVPPCDSEAFADAIITLLEDSKMSEAIVNNIVTVAQKYSMERVTEQLKEIYRSL